jgi:diguanylate cyclase (GGDEF)-like protein
MKDDQDLLAAETHAPDVRAQIAEAIRERRVSLVADLTTELTELRPSLDPRRWKRTAEQVIHLVTVTLERGVLDTRSPSLSELHHFAIEVVGVTAMFEAVYLAERTVVDELALHERLGATSEPWALVAQLVRRSSFRVLASLTERMGAGPPRGLLRDPLTTLLVRPVFELALAQEVSRADRFRHALSLILLDVDNLSSINAEHGYGVGDRVLERMGILVRRFFRQHDWVARLADDSIAALLPQTSLDDATDLANRVRRMVKDRLVSVDHNTGTPVRVTISAAAVGADVVETELDPYYVMAEAEDAVRRAKLSGRNRVERVPLVPASVSLIGAANLLGIQPFQVRRLIREKRLAALRRGRHLHIDRVSIDRYRLAMLGRERE